MIQLWQEDFGPGVHIAGNAAKFGIGAIIVAGPKGNGPAGAVFLDDFYALFQGRINQGFVEVKKTDGYQKKQQ